MFGMNEIHDLKANGRNIQVSEENKREYVKLVCQEKMIGSIRQQIDSFLEGFYEIIPKRFISIFDEQELELLIAGLPTIDIEELRAHTEYHKYDVNSMQVKLCPVYMRKITSPFFISSIKNLQCKILATLLT